MYHDGHSLWWMLGDRSCFMISGSDYDAFVLHVTRGNLFLWQRDAQIFSSVVNVKRGLASIVCI